MPETPDVARAGASLVCFATKSWLVPHDVTAPAVILIHGFTAHGDYLSKLAAYIEGYGLRSVIFNYDSHLGIDRAAEALVARLEPLKEDLSRHGFALIGHSMGGLVARCFVSRAPRHLTASLSGLALLGTPNSGVGGRFARLVMAYMLDWADKVTVVNPFSRSLACRATAQLIGTDADRLVDSLNAGAGGVTVPQLSVSGGLQ